MKIKLINKYNAFLAFFISILGFGVSCTKDDPVVEYGTPSAKFKVVGTVTDESDNPIEGIRVVLHPDSTLTDAQGNYEVNKTEFPGDKTLNVIFKDIDGDTNGTYIQKDSVVAFNNNQYQNGSGWYRGEVSKEIDIQLKED